MQIGQNIARGSGTISIPYHQQMKATFLQHLPKEPLYDIQPGGFIYWKRYQRKTALEVTLSGSFNNKHSSEPPGSQSLRSHFTTKEAIQNST